MGFMQLETRFYIVTRTIGNMAFVNVDGGQGGDINAPLDVRQPSLGLGPGDSVGYL